MQTFENLCKMTSLKMFWRRQKRIIHFRFIQGSSSLISFKDVGKNFLGNKKASNCKCIVQNMVKNFKNFGCHMSTKVHFLYSYLDFSPENTWAFCHDQGELSQEKIYTWNIFFGLRDIEPTTVGLSKVNFLD